MKKRIRQRLILKNDYLLQGSANHGPCQIQSAACYSNTRLFADGCFLTPGAELSYCLGDHMASMPKVFIPWPFTSFLKPWSTGVEEYRVEQIGMEARLL